MKVRIDREECISCEVCWTSCPQVFEQNAADSWSSIVQQFRVDGELGAGNVPDSLRECVNEAADGCPVEIIHIE